MRCPSRACMGASPDAVGPRPSPLYVMRFAMSLARARSRMVRWSSVALAIPLSLAPAQRGGRGQGQAPPPVAPRFAFVGPEPAGRIASVAGVAGDTTTYDMGAAAGVVWKTTDGARTFAPVFDDQSVQAIGALAVSLSYPRIVWAGTGEAWAIRDSDVMGDGVYKSTDA